MFRLISGISSKWLLALFATLLGGAAVAGTGAMVGAEDVSAVMLDPRFLRGRQGGEL